MPLGATLLGRKAGVVFTRCERLPAGPGYVELPVAGAGPFDCATPCGGTCTMAAQTSGPLAPACPSVLRLSLRLEQTRQELVAAALLAPPPLACDLPGVPTSTAQLSRQWTPRN